MIDARDPGRTDKFEVYIEETGQLVHSKKAGKGMAVSEYTRKQIKKKINKELIRQSTLRKSLAQVPHQ